MKTIPSSRVRLSCRVVRRWSGLIPGGAARHAESCPGCQAYFEAASALEGELRREARVWAHATPVPSTGFERRVMAAALRRPAPAAWERERFHRVWPLAATALAAVAAAALFRPERQPANLTAQADAALLANAVGTVSRQLVETVIPTAGEFAANNPLQQEFDAIYSDVRSAVGFLAMNFLPDSAARKVTPARSM